MDAGVGEVEPGKRPEWARQRMLYKLLRWVYERTGAKCGMAVTGAEIASALDLPHEHLYRLIQYLENRGYLVYLGAGPRVCISQRGIEYVSLLAGQRRSIRE